jgi:1-phosphatidylinositol phosphodiesterase
MKLVKGSLISIALILILSLEVAVIASKKVSNGKRGKFQSNSKLSKRGRREITDSFQDEKPKYTNANTTVNTSKWMAAIDGTKKLSQISIPGTHDTCTWDFESTGWTPNKWLFAQFFTLEEQLKTGVRYVDIRANKDGKIYHGSYPTTQTFEKVLATLKTFLTTNNQEVIVMRVKDEEKDDTGAFSGMYNSKLAPYSSLICQKNSIPTLNECRGKIWPILEFVNPSDGNFLWSDSNIVLQDDYQLIMVTFTISDKQGSIKKHIESLPKTPDGTKLYINHCSASPVGTGQAIKTVAKETNSVPMKYTGFLGITIFDYPSEKVILYVIQQNGLKKLRRR